MVEPLIFRRHTGRVGGGVMQVWVDRWWFICAVPHMALFLWVSSKRSGTVDSGGCCIGFLMMLGGFLRGLLGGYSLVSIGATRWGACRVCNAEEEKTTEEVPQSHLVLNERGMRLYKATEGCWGIRNTK